MTSSKLVSKRCRPALGTFVELALPPEAALDNLADSVFAEIERLENKFNFFSPTSLVTIINNAPVFQPVPIDDETLELIRLSLRLREASDLNFTPFVEEQEKAPSKSPRVPMIEFVFRGGGPCLIKLAPFRFDFSGIAKGFIVDRAIEILVRLCPEAEGSINAGGDLRFFGFERERRLSLRVGSPELGLIRELIVDRAAVATSSPKFASHFAGATSFSQTCFPRELQEPAVVSVTVLADSCAVADAMTKVALLASPPQTEKCRVAFMTERCVILRFDSFGELLDSYKSESG
jgi:FAD:protein FMN transferase